MENNKNDKLHVLSFNDKNIFLDDQKLEGVIDLKIEKNFTSTANVTLTLEAHIKGLDD